MTPIASAALAGVVVGLGLGLGANVSGVVLAFYGLFVGALFWLSSPWCDGAERRPSGDRGSRTICPAGNGTGMNFRHVIVVAALCAAGCGDGEQPRSAEGEERLPVAVADGESVTLSQVRAALKDVGLTVVETEQGSDVDAEISEPALASKRYEIEPSSREFGLYVFPTTALAREAVRDLTDTERIEDGGAVARGVNVVAVFPGPPGGFRGYEIVQRVLAELSTSTDRVADVRAREVLLTSVLAQPRDFTDETITVTGTVLESLRGGRSDYALVLGTGTDDEELLVVPDHAQAVSAAFDEGQTVRVTGRVDVVRAGGSDPAPDVIASGPVLERFEGEPAISATMIEEVDR